MRSRLPLSLLALSICAISSATQLTLLPAPAYGVSGNGRYVMANHSRFDVTNGSLFTFTSSHPYWNVPWLLTADGKSIVAELIVGDLGETQIYKLNDNGSSTALSNAGGVNASPYGISANGNVVIGEIQSGPGPFQCYRWINGSPASFGDALTAISGDGTTIFGDSWGTSVFWLNGAEFPIGEDGWDSPRVTDCSFDGYMAVGYYGSKAFRWYRGLGFTDIGNLPGTPGTVIPSSMNDDGSMIVGVETRDGVPNPFVYRHGIGMKTLAEYFTSRGIPVADWSFTKIKLSDNGEAMIGSGLYKGVQRDFHVWISGQHLTLQAPISTTPPGKTITGTVSFADKTPSPRVVTLTTTSSDVVLPATVTVPANAENVSFPIQVKAEAAGGKVTVNAAAGSLNAGFDLSITEPFSSMTLSSTRIHGGKYTRCTITFRPLRGPTQFIPKQVNGITMPAAINLPAGATTFSFNVVSPGIQVESLQTFAIKVSSPYHPERSISLQVFPPIGWMTVYPLEIKGGRTGLGRIGTTLAAGTGGLRYSLRSLSSLMSVPSSVSIPEGQTQCQFDVTTLPVTATAVRQIEARTALTVKTVNVTLVP